MWHIEKILRAYTPSSTVHQQEERTSALQQNPQRSFTFLWTSVTWKAFEVWPSIVKYVDLVKTKKLPYPGSSSYDTIAEARMDPLLLVKFHFFMAISRVFQPFLTKYQTDSPIMPFLWKDLENLIRVIIQYPSFVLIRVFCSLLKQSFFASFQYLFFLFNELCTWTHFHKSQYKIKLKILPLPYTYSFHTQTCTHTLLCTL